MRVADSKVGIRNVEAWMKVSWVVMLAASALFCSGVAKADGTDPTVGINKCSVGTCGTPSFTGQQTIVLNNTPLDFKNETGGPIYQLVLSLPETFGDTYQCFSNIFYTCTINASLGVEEIILNFNFNGGNQGPMECQNSNPVGQTCPGFIAEGDDFEIDSSGFSSTGVSADLLTPEPSTLFLLPGGLALLFGAARRRFAL